jgi:hypothetical protein
MPAGHRGGVERTRGGDSDGQQTNRRPESSSHPSGGQRSDETLLTGDTRTDGTPVTVYVNEQFEVVSVETR